MFTGLVEALGEVLSIANLGEGIVVRVQMPQDWMGTVKDGDSVSVNGVCSTALDLEGPSFRVDYLKETLDKTTFGDLKVGDRVNLERSLLPTTRIGGHFVTGHVDCTGEILGLDRQEPWGILTLGYPTGFRKFLVPKGSITIDGIALTLVEIDDAQFSCHLIPHTLDHTSLRDKRVGDAVNLEYDILGKYLYNFRTYDA